jgi:hypothetical protein
MKHGDITFKCGCHKRQTRKRGHWGRSAINGKSIKSIIWRHVCVLLVVLRTLISYLKLSVWVDLCWVSDNCSSYKVQNFTWYRVILIWQQVPNFNWQQLIRDIANLTYFNII